MYFADVSSYNFTINFLTDPRPRYLTRLVPTIFKYLVLTFSIRIKMNTVSVFPYKSKLGIGDRAPG